MNAGLQRPQRQLVRLLGVESVEQRAGKLENRSKHRVAFASLRQARQLRPDECRPAQRAAIRGSTIPSSGQARCCELHVRFDPCHNCKRPK